MNKIANRIIAKFQALLGRRKIYSLRENSTEFKNFFAQWYSQGGDLTIFCTDLDWLTDDDYSKVVESLMAKGNKLHLYLKEYNSNLVNQLVNSGADLHKVRSDIRTVHRFSIIGANQIIIRNKDNETTPIVVEEYSYNPALVNLALDMLGDSEVTSIPKK